MFIECPACKTRAQLPDSKEGAKVRCPDCSRVYVARPVGSRSRGARTKKQDPTPFIIAGGAAVVILIIGLMVSGSDKPDAPTAAASKPEPTEPEPLPAIEKGWNAPVVQKAVQLHEQAFTRNAVKLLTAIEFERAYAWRDATRVAALEAAAAEQTTDATTDEVAGEVAGVEPIESLPAWSTLELSDQRSFKSELVDEMISGEYAELISEWKPYDGDVISEDDELIIVHVKVHHRENRELADRTVEWRFAKVGGKPLAAAWERYISPEEKKAARRPKKTTKKTLSDGSQVIEGVVDSTRLEYHEETSEELRTEIEALIDQLIDPTARPKELTAARDGLTAIGKHAVPGLLMRLGEIPPDSDEQLIQLNQIHLLLQTLTGYLTTFDVHVAMGTTEERQESGIAQWFGWYDRKFKRYWREAADSGPAETEDVIWDDPAFQPRNEKERREFEKLRREYEEQKARERDG